MNTIRTYPRTLGEAFKGVDYACALERPARAASRTLAVAAVLVACVVLIGVAS